MSEASVNALTALEIGVPDLEAAVAFYENIWGLSPVARATDSCHLRASGADYFVLALHRSNAPALVRVRLSAENRQTVDALAPRVSKVGGRLLYDPRLLETPGGGYGFAFHDLEGREFQVVCDGQADCKGDDEAYGYSELVAGAHGATQGCGGDLADVHGHKKGKLAH